MSQQLINRSPDLKRLRDEGYDIEVRSGYLIVKDIPYVNAEKMVQRGMLVSILSLAGETTTTPNDHTVYFAGAHPCRVDGTEIQQIKHSSDVKELLSGLVANHMFSNKPSEPYPNYYEKMCNYITIISSQAEAIDPKATARTFLAFEAMGEDSVFAYVDTASSRADIGIATEKLKIGKVALVGLGGTGSYILDLVTKTPVGEIHLYDHDVFSQHNAFRSPGAPSVEVLRGSPQKVVYFKELYSKIHARIVDHDAFVDATNIEDLRAMDFVFLSLDGGPAKHLIVEKLEGFGTPFVDVGMGLYLADGSLGGVVRTTTSTANQRDHVHANGRISFAEDDAQNEYSKNIQVADLNALNAAFAVIKWKKLCGFYHDLEHEHFSTYTIDGNAVKNEDLFP